MTLTTYLYAAFCVIAASVGQIMVKFLARALNASGSWLDATVIAWLGATGLLYGIGAFIWVAVLQKASLSEAYPMIALSFILVPLASVLVFRDTVSPAYWLGTLLIMGGITIIGSSVR